MNLDLTVETLYTHGNGSRVENFFLLPVKETDGVRKETNIPNRQTKYQRR